MPAEIWSLQRAQRAPCAVEPHPSERPVEPNWRAVEPPDFLEAGHFRCALVPLDSLRKVTRARRRR